MNDWTTPRDAPRPRLASVLRQILLFAGCVGVSVTLLRGEVLPLGAVRAEDLASDYGLLTWDLWATTEAALQGRSLYRTDLLFFPLGSSLAAHTLGPGFVPVAAAARLALNGDATYALYAHRLSILLCFSLGAFLAHRAFRSLGAGALPAFAAAVGWVSAACWALILANQTLSSACALIPAVTLLLVRVVRHPTAGRAAAAAAGIAASVYFSEYFSAFIALAVVVVAVAALARADTRASARRVLTELRPRGLAAAAAVGLLAGAPFLSAWSGTEVRAPGQRQIYAGGANLASFVCPDPAITPVYGGAATAWLHARITRGSGPFLGIPTVLLAAVGLAACERRLRWILASTAGVFLVLSLGPVLKVFGTRTGLPTPYAALMHLPVLDMARDPQRLAVLGIWSLLCLASIGLTALAGQAARRRAWASTLVGVIALCWWACEGYRPGTAPRTFVPPEELQHLPPGVVANVPLSITDGGAMLLQVFHRRPIVTGYVSRGSQAQYDHVRRLQDLLDADPSAFVAALRALGVGTVILQPGFPDDAVRVIGESGLYVVDLRAGLDTLDRPL